MALRQDHQGLPNVSVLGQVAGGASAARDAGHLDAILDLSREEARGCLWAWGRDSLSVKAATERSAALVHRAAHRGRQRQGERQKAVYLLEQWAVLRQAFQAVQQARRDESELALGPRVRWAS
jgi:hypothetical protein